MINELIVLTGFQQKGNINAFSLHKKTVRSIDLNTLTLFLYLRNPRGNLPKLVDKIKFIIGKEQGTGNRR
ncbi:MAG: hypothetical protein QNJ53_16690 [Pleurocapsa sp. MO_192.B19]|nr:hypothetical protein [Pleurocapsa sp. MO_192.B19]